MTESRKKKEKKQTVYEMQLEFKEATEEVVSSFLKVKVSLIFIAVLIFVYERKWQA